MILFCTLVVENNSIKKLPQYMIIFIVIVTDEFETFLWYYKDNLIATKNCNENYYVWKIM